MRKYPEDGLEFSRSWLILFMKNRDVFPVYLSLFCHKQVREERVSAREKRSEDMVEICMLSMESKCKWTLLRTKKLSAASLFVKKNTFHKASNKRPIHFICYSILCSRLWDILRALFRWGDIVSLASHFCKHPFSDKFHPQWLSHCLPSSSLMSN